MKKVIKGMKLSEIIKIVSGKLITKGIGESLEIVSVCGTEMMSDALRNAVKGALLITSLNQPQVIRTAEIADIPAVLIVLGKPISNEMIIMAQQKEIAIITTNYSLFTSCGLLYQNGIRSCLELQSN
ncbi:MAG: DRTGG domain-containing protein [Thermodesulfovibrionales bacterium]|nr:DRTGG domain-containing protein [Thermodesulfovibrionales bacterium]